MHALIDPAADLLAIEKDKNEGRRAHARACHTLARGHRHYAGDG